MKKIKFFLVLGLTFVLLAMFLITGATVYSAIEYNILEDQGAIEFPPSPWVTIGSWLSIIAFVTGATFLLAALTFTIRAKGKKSSS
ncbi:MAG: hypothetical protein ACRCSP_02610 [Rhodoglobus sp.]